MNSLQHRWSFLCRVLDGAAEQLAPLEDIIHRRLIPAISGRTAPSEAERILLTFPCRHGGLGVANPTIFGSQYGTSRLITTALEFGGGGRFERTFIDVRVFNPYASSNRTSSSLSACYRHHEQEKRRRYDRRVREVERSTFLPFVLSSTGGCGKGAAALVTRIAHLQSLRGREAYSVLIAHLRCRLSFALLRSSVMTLCLRGARRVWQPPMDGCASLAVVEARVSR